MITRALDYFEAAVDLLGKHNSRQMMRKGHFTHAEPHIRSLLYALGHSERASYKEAYLAPAGQGEGIYLPGKLLAFELLCTHTHSYDIRILGYCFFNVGTFPRKCILYFLIRGLVAEFSLI